MTQEKSNIGKLRKKYSSQFKEQTLERAKKDGIAKVAKELGLG